MRLAAQDLSKSYVGHPVLNIAKASFGEHGIEGLIGPNGAGKSTLLGCLTRRIPPTTGSVQFDTGTESHDLMPIEPHEVARLGLIKTNQRIQGFDSLTIKEGLRLVGTPPEAEDWRAIWTLPEPNADLEGEIEALMARFPFADPEGYAKSGGEKKLADILRCLIAKPRMLLMDEPTAGLPEEITQEVMTLIQEKVAAGEMTVVIIEHDLDLIWANCAYVHFLSEGEILFEGSPEDVKGNRVVAEKYMGV